MGIYDSRSDRFNSSVTNSRDYLQAYNECIRLLHKSHDFQGHNQCMTAFRLAHSKNWVQWGQMVSEVQENPLALLPIVLMRGSVLARYSPN